MSVSASVEKKRLREKYKLIRDSIPLQVRKDYDRLLFEKILESALYKSSDLLLLYYPIGSEFNTLPLVQLQLSMKTAFPKTTDKLIFCEYNPRFVKGKFGIPEPTGEKIILENYQNILAVVPALALDSNGYRLGYGGGYYDKFLSENRNIKSIGCCYPEIFTEKLPVEEFDIQIDNIIRI